jgi:hypothetical protein
VIFLHSGPLSVWNDNWRNGREPLESDTAQNESYNRRDLEESPSTRSFYSGVFGPMPWLGIAASQSWCCVGGELTDTGPAPSQTHWFSEPLWAVLKYRLLLLSRKHPALDLHLSHALIVPPIASQWTGNATSLIVIFLTL